MKHTRILAHWLIDLISVSSECPEKKHAWVVPTVLISLYLQFRVRVCVTELPFRCQIASDNQLLSWLSYNTSLSLCSHPHRRLFNIKYELYFFFYFLSVLHILLNYFMFSLSINNIYFIIIIIKLCLVECPVKHCHKKQVCKYIVLLLDE